MIELLVVVAVIALLVCLRLPMLAKAERGTKIAQCTSNLRQTTLAMLICGGENNEKLPSNQGSGFWAWDTPWSIGDQMNRCGAPWQVMYCPGTAPRFTDADNYSLYNYAPGSFRVLGYSLTLEGTFGLSSTNWNATLTPPRIQVAPGVFITQLPAERVLVADATISASGQYTDSLRYTYNYTSIPGGYPKAHLSPHLTGGFPLGCNVSMLDGHVEWRKFADMNQRATGTGPGFWW